MANPLTVKVKEREQELKRLQKSNLSKLKKLSMLLLLKKQPSFTSEQSSLQTGASQKSIQTWRSKYLQGGIDLLLNDNRGGYKAGAVTLKASQALAKRLNNPKEGFRSFVEIQQWLATEFGIEMNYHAINKYVKRKYGAKLKVSRKSHVLKSPADEAVFKKPVQKL